MFALFMKPFKTFESYFNTQSNLVLLYHLIRSQFIALLGQIKGSASALIHQGFLLCYDVV